MGPPTQSPLASLSIFDVQNDLGILGAHAEQGSQPQPEHSAVTAHGGGLRCTDDITGAHRGRQGSGHSLSGRNRAFSGLLLLEDLTNGILHGMAEMAELDAAVADGQERAANNGKGQERVHPRKGIQRSCKKY